MHKPAGSNDLEISTTDLRTDTAFAELLTGSYRRLLGRPLVDESAMPPTALWLYQDAPFCLLAHDGAEDPHFVYANAAAQACFGYEWETFTRLPSRLSAETPDQAERERLLDAVKRQGFIDDYRGIRVAKSGRRFWIEAAVVWELIDATSARHGQAAVFHSWRDL